MFRAAAAAAGIVLLIAALQHLAVTAQPGTGASWEVLRLAGPTRVETAIALSQDLFPDGAASVYVASADTLVDAMTAGVADDGPVLVVPRCDLPAQVGEEITRLAPTRVVVLGGSAAICEEVVEALRELGGGAEPSEPVDAGPPGAAPPPLGETYADPHSSAPVRRVTDRASQGGFGTHIYSQLQAFSEDGALLLLIEDGAYVVRRVADLQALPVATDAWNAPRWLPGEPASIVHFDSNDDTTVRVQTTEVTSGTTRTVATLPNRYERVFVNQSFDAGSRDGRWIAGALDAGGDMVLFAYDLHAQQLAVELSVDALYAGPCVPDPEHGAVPPDWVGISPHGTWLVVQWVRDGTARCSGLESFSTLDGSFAGRTTTGHAHGDLAVRADGSEAFVTTALASAQDPNRPALVIVNLPGSATAGAAEEITTLQWGEAGHVSCQGPPGACVLSNDRLDSDGAPLIGGTIEHVTFQGARTVLANHYSSACGYWVQPRASVSGDGRQVVFASDWAEHSGEDGCGDSALGRGDAYVIDVP